MSTAEVNARRADRRAQLLDAADAVVRRRGPAASMDDIAAQAGVTKPIVYRHFGDKAGLYDALSQRYVDALLARLAQALQDAPDDEAEQSRARLFATIATYLGFVDEHRQAYRFLFSGDPAATPKGLAVRSAFIRRVAEEVASLLARGPQTVTDEATARAWGHGIVGMVQLAGDWWLDEPALSREELAASLTRLLWSGMGGAPAP